jgi:hypothetical protein
MTKSVLFLHRYGPQFASYRYRAEIPARQLGKSGFKIGINEPGDYEIIVASKPCEEDLPVLEEGKKQGCKIIVDFADDHFNGNKAEVHHKIAFLADRIVTGTEVMSNRLKEYIGRESTIIGDPYEQELGVPHADGDNLLWFGHQVNMPDLTGVSQFLKGRHIHVVSGPRPIPNVTPWSPENLVSAFRQCNIVILPTREGSEHKTANRLINSLRAGCFPVCMDHPSYFEFRDFVWVGNFLTGLRWTDAFKDILNELVTKGQEYIELNYSPERIGLKWKTMLEGV